MTLEPPLTLPPHLPCIRQLCVAPWGYEVAELPSLPIRVCVGLCVENQTLLLSVYVCVDVGVCARVFASIDPPSFLIMKWNYSSITSCSAIGWR